ncbi:MAG: hypothetical protein D3919_06260 [Candidatus Electrothrix sp. AW5]|nr:hypothetical protein [Candidatus Electrothrix gigas]
MIGNKIKRFHERKKGKKGKKSIKVTFDRQQQPFGDQACGLLFQLEPAAHGYLILLGKKGKRA